LYISTEALSGGPLLLPPGGRYSGSRFPASGMRATHKAWCCTTHGRRAPSQLGREMERPRCSTPRPLAPTSWLAHALRAFCCWAWLAWAVYISTETLSDHPSSLPLGRGHTGFRLQPSALREGDHHHVRLSHARTHATHAVWGTYGFVVRSSARNPAAHGESGEAVHNLCTDRGGLSVDSRFTHYARLLVAMAGLGDEYRYVQARGPPPPPSPWR
jgi:hypothetical protein